MSAVLTSVWLCHKHHWWSGSNTALLQGTMGNGDRLHALLKEIPVLTLHYVGNTNINRPSIASSGWEVAVGEQ